MKNKRTMLISGVILIAVIVVGVFGMNNLKKDELRPFMMTADVTFETGDGQKLTVLKDNAIWAQTKKGKLTFLLNDQEFVSTDKNGFEKTSEDNIQMDAVVMMISWNDVNIPAHTKLHERSKSGENMGLGKVIIETVTDLAPMRYIHTVDFAGVEYVEMTIAGRVVYVAVSDVTFSEAAQ